nr:type IV secretory system conjugative DNA transfer family protein [Reinekea sp. G2M2-21]
MKALGTSGFNLGRKLGTAVEQARRQQVLSDFYDIFDRSFRFDLTMVESPEGRIIIPPVIDRVDDTSRLSDDGRRIRIIDIVYTIRKNAKFAIVPPSWRDYLMAPIEYPNEYDLINAVLPETKAELSYWRDKVVEGYLVGNDLAKAAYERRFARLKEDYVGMQRYHLLRAFNMVSEPVITSDLYVATGSRDGTTLNLDDANLSIAVEPNMIPQAMLHRAIPRIREFEHFGLDENLLPNIDGGVDE